MKRCGCTHYKYVHDNGTGFCYASYPKPCECQEYQESESEAAAAQIAPSKIVEAPVTVKSPVVIQTLLGGSAQNVKASPVEITTTSTVSESGVFSVSQLDKPDDQGREYSLEEMMEILRGQPPWRGAVPDMDKLQASTQMDARGLWWGWDCPEELKKFLGIVWRDWVAQSRCDICIYEAAGCYLGVYYCRLHEKLII